MGNQKGDVRRVRKYRPVNGKLRGSWPARPDPFNLERALRARKDPISRN